MSIRQKVTLVAISVTLVVSAILVLVAHMDKVRLEERVAHEVLLDRALIWKQVTEQLFEHMEAGIPAFEDDFFLRKALQTGDTAALTQAIDTVATLTADQQRFDRLDVFDTANVRQCCGREGSPVAADVPALTRMTTGDARRHRALGRNARGEPVALLAFTLEVRHQPVGTVVFEKTLAAPLQRFKAIAGSDVYLIAADGRSFAGTDPELFTRLGLEREPWPNERAYRQVVRGDSAHAVAILPITGVDGTAIARLISVSDASQAFVAQRRFEQLAYTSVFLVLVLATTGLYWYMRRTLRPLGDAMTIAGRIADGHLDTDLIVSGRDEISLLLISILRMQSNLRVRIDAEQRLLTETLRIKSALDKASTSLMVTDQEGVLIYVNDAFQTLMRESESDMRQVFPEFRAQELLGHSLAELCPHAGQRLLEVADGAQVTQIAVGGRTFRLTADPVSDEHGRRLGIVVEPACWRGRSSSSP